MLLMEERTTGDGAGRKGGITLNEGKSNPVSFKEEADKFYASWEWARLRFRVLSAYGAVCMCCASKDKIVVDHIKPRRHYPNLELDFNNMQVLCDSCNRGKSDVFCTDFRNQHNKRRKSKAQRKAARKQRNNELHAAREATLRRDRWAASARAAARSREYWTATQPPTRAIPPSKFPTYSRATVPYAKGVYLSVTARERQKRQAAKELALLEEQARIPETKKPA